MQLFIRDQDGATAIEYALICAVVVLVFLVGLVALGGKSTNQYNSVATKIEKSM